MVAYKSNYDTMTTTTAAVLAAAQLNKQDSNQRIEKTKTIVRTKNSNHNTTATTKTMTELNSKIDLSPSSFYPQTKCIDLTNDLCHSSSSSLCNHNPKNEQVVSYDSTMFHSPVRRLSPIFGWSIRDSEQQPRRPSTASSSRNETLLSTAFVSFLLFAMAQLVAALAAHSVAMIGDTSAMFVDCLTYLTNFVAERYKHRIIHGDTISKDLLLERNQRKRILTCEVVPPLISVTCLMGVTWFVLEDSIRTLSEGVKPKSAQGTPNLRLMLIFSGINLLIDVLNVTCFAKKKMNGYCCCCGWFVTTTATWFTTSKQTTPLPTTTTKTANMTAMTTCDLEEGHLSDVKDGTDHFVMMSSCPGRAVKVSSLTEKDDDESKCGTPTTSNMMKNGNDITYDSHPDYPPKLVTNLNMCSAYTHVLADTMRSIAVLVAALLAMVVKSITAEEADAAAAVIVSFVIMLTVLPLVRGICANIVELWHIRQEEQADLVLSSSQTLQQKA